MHSLPSLVVNAFVTAVLSAACWWLWAGDHGLAWRLGLESLDLQIRVLSIFGLLSMMDQIFARIGLRLAASQDVASS